MIIDIKGKWIIVILSNLIKDKTNTFYDLVKLYFPSVIINSKPQWLCIASFLIYGG